jgi:cytochrome c553
MGDHVSPALPPERARRPARSLPLALALASAALGAPAAPARAQDARTLQLRSLAAGCAQCHGTEGRSVAEGMARLAGADAGWLAGQLRAFRDGRRPATVMQQIAKGYSEAQIDALAGYFAAQR